MRSPIFMTMLGVGAFGALMALRAQVSGTGARGLVAALAFACLGVSLTWLIGRARKGSLPP